MNKSNHDAFIQTAIEEARKSLATRAVPIISVIALNDEIIGRGHNKRIQQDSVIKHGTMSTLENTGRLRASDYQKCTLYSTLSP
ncbi:deaminase [Microbulbifer sp. DLAB2-AF]|uniref:deaminase n=1 Tax=Microbulbifer sp. DLAB2-AF TaxID=3243395 RepID=UPI00403976FE